MASILFFLLLVQDPFREGLLAMQRGDWKTAQGHLENSTRLKPGDARAWLALAQVYAKSGLWEKSGAAADKAATLGAKDPLVQSTLPIYYFEAVQPLLQQQKFTAAVAILEKARKVAPNDAQLELAAGVAYYGARHFDDAAAAFLNTIRIAPEIEQPYLFLGRFLDQIAPRLPEITKAFEAYAKAHPDRGTGHLLHAKALNAQSIEPALARQLIGKALSLNPDNAASHFELGALLFRQQQYAEAAQAWERSAQLDPRNAAVHYRLSLVYRRLGRHEAADAERALHAKYEKDLEAGKYQQ